MKTDFIRPPVVTGSFYSDDPDYLKRQITDFLSRAEKTELEGKIYGLISPHAGYVYSGQVAAWAYKQVSGERYESVVVIAPSHREYFPLISVFEGAGYRTPLGDVPVDQELAQGLADAEDKIILSSEGHRDEHSLEVQLPFLQMVLGDFRMVPVVMGDQGLENCRRLGEALARVLSGKPALVVASTDLSHFHPYQTAVDLDRVVIQHLEDYDVPGLSQDLEGGNCEACGGGPMMAAMIGCQKLGARKARAVQYKNSGDVTGDKSGVVGYLGGVLFG